MTRALNMTVLSVAVPEDVSSNKEGEEENRGAVATDQLMAALRVMGAGFLKRFIYGDPYLGIEIAVPKGERRVHTYFAVPRAYKSIFQKQIHSVFPYANIEEVKDYTIFDDDSVAQGSYLYTSRSNMLPINTYKNLSSDPMSSLITAMSRVGEAGDGAAFQMLLRPTGLSKERDISRKTIKEMQKGKDFYSARKSAGGSFGKEVGKAVSEVVSGGKSKQEVSADTAVNEDLIKAIQEKIAKHHYKTTIRLVAAAKDELTAENALSGLESAFSTYDNPEGNNFSTKRVSKRNLKKFIFDYSFRIPVKGKKYRSYLSTEEIASLAHIGVTKEGISNIKSLKYRAVEPPHNLPQEGTIIGESDYRGEKIPIRMTLDDRRRHTYFIGQTGTGKSGLMEQMIKQDIQNGEGVAVLDPHGELVNDVLRHIPPERQGDVVWFDPGDVTRPFGLNFLEYDPDHPEQKTLVVNELLAIFRRLFSEDTMGPVFDQYFRNAVLLLLGDYRHEIPTMLDIQRVLIDEEYRKDKLSRETNEVVKRFWEEEAQKVKGEAALSNIAPYITSKINGFVADEFIRPIISQKQSTINFRDAMDNKKIILVNLSKGKIGELNANLIGLVIVGKILMAALSRTDIDNASRNDFFLYIDEFQNFTTDSISSILSEARKYKLNLIIGHQFIDQLDDKIREAVFGNVGSIIALRVGADDAEYLEKQFAPTFSKEDLMNIDNYRAYVKLLINGQTTKPFNMNLINPKDET